MNQRFWLTEQDVARITKRALSTLRNERHLGRGIPYCKIGKSIRYASDDVDSFMNGHRIETEGK
jgi:hypothetical protein